MRDEMKKVPRLRFRGFQEDWELCKVGDFGREIYGGGTPKTSVKEFWSGTLPWIQSSDLKEDKVCDIKAKKHISVKAIQQSSAKKISKNSIAIVTRVSVGKLVLMPYEYATSQDFLSISVLQVDKWFGVYSLYNKLQSELNSVQGTSIKGITKDELLNKKIMIPKPLKEQSKIGLFLKKIDTTIALHQRKLEQLKEFKKAYLQVMFPEKDERVPKLRFADFEEEWEHRKLDDSIKVMDGDRGANYPHDTDFFKDGDTLFLDTGNVTKNGFKFDSVKYITNEKDEQLRAGKLEKNDFVLTSRGTLGNVGFYDEVVYNLHPKIRINSAMLILRNTDEQLSYSYLHTLLKGQLISDFMKKNQVGSAQPHITKSEFLKLNLNVPRNINEQNKIGNFFKSLDVTITLHQNKLTQLKSLKKSYLQNMFI
ncbi:restriction endonuclease subunit S [Enterococcus faecalis]|nr:restriction endonuclease subunit S [Enterococcus faecalis]EGO5136069.1 restriction endonuclease subunit S [Enterococcus faecalis]EGO5994900.1 restriction endonuclease subunit S [Enterococcus faecalis]EGO9155678.1 restriction endonuclease subunit S [Enterococcus faecalis]EHU5030278.1 restriction endonuclease subunit S [Enterococcus faecalis]